MVILGIFFIMLSFVCISSAGVPGTNYEPFLVGAMVGAALGSVLIAKGRAKQKQKQAQQQTVIVNNYTIPQPSSQSAPGMVVQHTSAAPSVPVARAEVYTSPVFPVAGVTFDNEDGSSRQELLREICEGPLQGDDESCWLDPYFYNGEMALHVMTGGGCVGNIRRSDVQEVLGCIKASEHGARLEAELFEAEDGRKIYRADVIFDD